MFSRLVLVVIWMSDTTQSDGEAHIYSKAVNQFAFFQTSSKAYLLRAVRLCKKRHKYNRDDGSNLLPYFKSCIGLNTASHMTQIRFKKGRRLRRKRFAWFEEPPCRSLLTNLIVCEMSEGISILSPVTCLGYLFSIKVTMVFRENY